MKDKAEVMKRAWSGAVAVLVALCAGLLATGRAVAEDTIKANFYVATNGSDTWSGTLATPNVKKTDGPFATLTKARNAVRDLRKRARLTGPVRVLVRGGFYPIAEPLALDTEDGGSKEIPTIFAAYPDEKPMVSGGLRLTGWERTDNGQWETRLPEVVEGKWSFSQLYVNGGRRYRPRLPKNGYFTVKDAYPSTEKNSGQGYDRFRFAPGDMKASWAEPHDIEVLTFHIWSMSRFPLASVDEKEQVVTLAGRTYGTPGYADLSAGRKYIVENVREALSDPGEWYLDKRTGVLRYIPLKGEQSKKTEVIAPHLEKLVVIDGANYVQFHGISFAHTGWSVPANGYSFPQAEMPISAAIEVTNAQGVVFDSCKVQHTRGWAISLGRAAQYCRIHNCELTDLGAGGVKLGETEMRPEGEAAGHNVVTESLIAHAGRVHPAAIGVFIGHSAYNVVKNNEIADLYYTAISIGWTWGYGASGAHHNVIEDNHLHHIGQGVLSDMGGIYTLGISPGTMLRHNWIHDIYGVQYGGWGIYFDEGSTGIVAENNVVYNMSAAPFHQHYGKENVMRNNVLALGREAQLMRTRPEDHLSFTLERNLVYAAKGGDGPILGSNWSGDTTRFRLQNNLYWRADDKPITFRNGADLKKWQSERFDANSIIADPMFVNPAKGDFRLRPGSPATRIGFVPIDLTKVGRMGKAPVGLAPRAYPLPPPPAPPAPQQPITIDFESTAPGVKPSGAQLSVSEDASIPVANIRVTGETAATGKRSLKFTDAPGQAVSYNPHLFYSPNFTDGILVGKFALRHETGAIVYHEWRDDGSPYRVGPSLIVRADGTIVASGKEIGKLSPGEWVNVEIVCALGAKTAGTYDLSVETLNHRPIAAEKKLPCGAGKDFRQLRWWGFVANATENAMFYLDNLSLAPKK